MEKSGVQININRENLNNSILTQVHQRVFPSIQNNAPSYFALESNQKKKDFEKIKNKLINIANQLEGNKDVRIYFQAYETILDIREFFLGEKGAIDYKILFATKGRGSSGEAAIHEIIIDRKTFSEIILGEENKNFLQVSGNNLRFTRAFVTKLKQIATNIQKSDGFSFEIDNNNFRVNNEIIGASRDYKGADIFKKEIERQAKLKKGNRYVFEIELEKVTSIKDEKDILSYKIRGVSGGADSQSIFSAIGKYTADEIEAKNNIIKGGGFNTQVYIPNRGNLSEIYSLAKMKLNNDKNKFGSNGEKRFVSGQNLFHIYQQVLGNIDPFYSGGDILSTQIKSFLGSCPSLTSFDTIKKTIENFKEILNKDNFDEMKKELEKKLIQEKESVLNAENDLAKELSEMLAKTIEILKS